MQIVINDHLLKQAQAVSGLPDYQTVVEVALRTLIEKQQQQINIAGCLSQYAHTSPMPC